MIRRESAIHMNELTIIVPITCAAAAGRVARYRSATNEGKLLWLLLDLGRRSCDGRRGRDRRLWALFVALSHGGGFAGLATGAELIEAEGARSEVGALVETAFIADDLAGVEGGAAPRGRLGGVAVEAATAEILCLLAGGVVCVLDGDSAASGRGKIRGGVGSVDGVCRVAQLGGDDQGGVFEFDRMGVSVMSVGRIGRDGEGLIIHGWVLVIIRLLWQIVSDIGEGSATVDRMVWGLADVQMMMLLLLLLPLIVVGLVVDVDVWLVPVLRGVVVVELLEERGAARVDGVLVVDGLVLDHVSTEKGVWGRLVVDDGERLDRLLKVDGGKEVPSRVGRRRSRRRRRVRVGWRRVRVRR